MTVRQETDPATNGGVEISLDYALAQPDALIGIHPDQRHEEIRRQLLAGPLDAVSSGEAGNQDGVAADAEIQGDHNFDPETGKVTGQLTLVGKIRGHDRMSPDKMIAAARPHFAQAMASDIGVGMEINLAQHQASPAKVGTGFASGDATM